MLAKLLKILFCGGLIVAFSFLTALCWGSGPSSKSGVSLTDLQNLTITINANGFVGNGSQLTHLGSTRLSTGDVTTSKIADGAITNSKLATGSFSAITDVVTVNFVELDGGQISADGISGAHIFCLSASVNSGVTAGHFYGDGSKLTGLALPGYLTVTESLTTTVNIYGFFPNNRHDNMRIDSSDAAKFTPGMYVGVKSISVPGNSKIYRVSSASGISLNVTTLIGTRQAYTGSILGYATWNVTYTRTVSYNYTDGYWHASDKNGGFILRSYSLSNGSITNSKLATGSFTAITGLGTVSSCTKLTATTVSVNGNISASYYRGNGSLLTNLPTGALPDGSVTNSKIATGTFTAITLSSASQVTGLKKYATQNVLTITDMSGLKKYATQNVLSGSDISDGSIINSKLATGSFTAITGLGTVSSCTKLTATTVSVNNNISAAYFIGDGSKLTNLPAGALPNGSITNSKLVTGSFTAITTTGVLSSLKVTGNVITTGYIRSDDSIRFGNNSALPQTYVLSNNTNDGNDQNVLIMSGGGYNTGSSGRGGYIELDGNEVNGSNVKVFPGNGSSSTASGYTQFYNGGGTEIFDAGSSIRNSKTCKFYGGFNAATANIGSTSNVSGLTDGQLGLKGKLIISTGKGISTDTDAGMLNIGGGATNTITHGGLINIYGNTNGTFKANVNIFGGKGTGGVNGVTRFYTPSSNIIADFGDSTGPTKATSKFYSDMYSSGNVYLSSNSFLGCGFDRGYIQIGGGSQASNGNGSYMYLGGVRDGLGGLMEFHPGAGYGGNYGYINFYAANASPTLKLGNSADGTDHTAHFYGGITVTGNSTFTQPVVEVNGHLDLTTANGQVVITYNVSTFTPTLAYTTMNASWVPDIVDHITFSNGVFTIIRAGWYTISYAGCLSKSAGNDDIETGVSFNGAAPSPGFESRMDTNVTGYNLFGGRTFVRYLHVGDVICMKIKDLSSNTNTVTFRNVCFSVSKTR